MKEIQVKTFMNEWVTVTKKQAKDFATTLYQLASAWKKEEKPARINERLRGITYEELMNKK